MPFFRAINEVKPSKIRIEADEVTYNLHIIIRFQLEQDLFADKITISDLPEIWNQKYKQYLSQTIENDSEGVMQDTHWASGLFGYFPSYALGNIYSGQMVSKINEELPDWRIKLSEGNLKHIKRWLNKKVYKEGDLYDPPDLVRRITGRNLDLKPYLDYLREKYSQIYEF